MLSSRLWNGTLLFRVLARLEVANPLGLRWKMAGVRGHLLFQNSISTWNIPRSAVCARWFTGLARDGRCAREARRRHYRISKSREDLGAAAHILSARLAASSRLSRGLLQKFCLKRRWALWRTVFANEIGRPKYFKSIFIGAAAHVPSRQWPSE